MVIKLNLFKILKESALTEKLNELQKINDFLKSENDRLNAQLISNDDEKRFNLDKIKEEIQKLKLEVISYTFNFLITLTVIPKLTTAVAIKEV